jgi:hypothetical protein
MVAHYEILVLNRLLEVLYIILIGLTGFGYHRVMYHGTIFEKPVAWIRAKAELDTGESLFWKEWVDKVILGSCAMCVAGNIAFFSKAIYPAEGLLMWVIRICGAMAIALITNKIYESERL